VLWDWYYQVATAPEIGPLKKALSIIQYDGAHEELRRWNLRDAFPVKWVGPNLTTSASQVGIESLELAYAEFEMVARG
jgi:phage tail-like protein